MRDLPALPLGPRRPAPGARLRRAFSLLEVIIGMSLFTLTAMGVMALTFMVRATSERAVYNNTALTLAQAYLEQLRSIDYGTLRNAANDTAGTVSLTVIGSNGAGLNNESGGVFANGNWARETIMLDEDEAGTPRQPMTFRFRPLLSDLETITGGTAEGVEIVLYYESTYNFGTPRTQSGSLRTVRSNVSTY